MSAESTSWTSPSNPAFVGVTLTGCEEVYLLAHKRCDYPTLLTFVHAMFEVSGNPECVWLEGDGIKFILVLDFWNDYAAAFEGKKVVFQFQGEAKADGDAKPSGALVLTYSTYPPITPQTQVTLLFRDNHRWKDVSDIIRRSIRMPRAVTLEYVVKEPYPKWWLSQFRQDSVTVVDSENWELIVAAASHFGPDKVTDLYLAIAQEK